MPLAVRRRVKCALIELNNAAMKQYQTLHITQICNKLRY
jgi:hypothetical protein